MEFTMCNLKTQNYVSPVFMTSSLCSTNSKHGLVEWVPPKSSKMMKGRIKCGKNTSVMVELDLERQLHEIVNEGREWREMKNCCKEEISSSSSSSSSSAELIELLECLEREAIMGNDEGREAIDYNRRAKIFDKSSKVFQALKENAPSPTN